MRIIVMRLLRRMRGELSSGFGHDLVRLTRIDLRALMALFGFGVIGVAGARSDWTTRNI